jgi:hypothetical protein
MPILLLYAYPTALNRNNFKIQSNNVETQAKSIHIYITPHFPDLGQALQYSLS